LYDSFYSLYRVKENREIHFIYFFFQAEDGIRDFHVTGVQTCALPIYTGHACALLGGTHTAAVVADPQFDPVVGGAERQRDPLGRSEERRVGKEWKYRDSTHEYNKHKQDGVRPLPLLHDVINPDTAADR